MAEHYEYLVSSPWYFWTFVDLDLLANLASQMATRCMAGARASPFTMTRYRPEDKHFEAAYASG